MYSSPPLRGRRVNVECIFESPDASPRRSTILRIPPSWRSSTRWINSSDATRSFAASIPHQIRRFFFFNLEASNYSLFVFFIKSSGRPARVLCTRHTRGRRLRHHIWRTPILPSSPYYWMRPHPFVTRRIAPYITISTQPPTSWLALLFSPSYVGLRESR